MLHTYRTDPVEANNSAAEHIAIDSDWTADIYREWDFPSEVIGWWQSESNRQGDAGLFTSPGWLEQCFRAWEAELLVVVLRARERIRGIFPCRIARNDFGDPAICSLAIDANHYGFVPDGGADEVTGAFVRLVAKSFPSWHLQFDCLCNNSAVELQRSFEERGFRLWKQTETCAPCISLSGRREEFLRSLNSKFRRELGRCRRNAEQGGFLCWEEHRSGPSIQDLLTEAFAMQSRGWKGHAGTAVAHKPVLERFLRLATEWAARMNKLDILVLRYKGAMAAFLISFVSDGTVFAYEMSFDEQCEIARWSPGQLLIAKALERGFGNPSLHKFNMLGPYSEWKKRWTQQVQAYHWLTVYPGTARGRFQYFKRHGWKDPLKRSPLVRQITKRFRTQ